MDAAIAWFQALPLADLIKGALAIVGGGLGLVAGGIGVRAAIINLNRQHQAKLIQDQTLWSGTVSDFTKDDVTRALKHYVAPDCSQTDPANSADIRKSAGIREQVVKVVDRFISDSEMVEHRR